MQAYFPSIWERIRHRCKHKGEHLHKADISIALVEGPQETLKGGATLYQACLRDDILWGGPLTV